MLQNIAELYDTKLTAWDGDIGKAKDFYFDDATRMIRYAVVDTGAWLTGRLVLLSPLAFGRFDQVKKILTINLTRQQIENSPSIESHVPVSRQYEIDYYRYYQWPAYWDGGLPSLNEENNTHQPQNANDRHLQSTSALTGYHIQAVDGTIGHVSGFLVDDESWAIHKIVVDTGPWYSEKEILISPDKIERISHEESKIFVNLTRTDIEQTAENDIAVARVRNH